MLVSLEKVKLLKPQIISKISVIDSSENGKLFDRQQKHIHGKN